MNNELSLYNDEIADVKLIATELRKLKAVFPMLENDFISVLAERISANGFTEQRLKDAISNVIDTFKYQRPNIADIISFDSRIKLYTGKEFCDAQVSGTPATEFYRHYIGERLFFVKIADCERYNFKPNTQKPTEK